MVNLSAVAREFEGQWLAERYRLLKLLGAGSFGCVFSAEEQVGGRVLRTVAVKVQQPGVLGPGSILDELAASTRLRHPSLVDAFAPGEATLTSTAGAHRLFFLVMEKAEGTLQDRLSKGWLKAQEALELAGQIAEGLQYLHAHRIAHRDVKPSNILWIDGRWKLSDFGVSKELVSEQTEDGAGGGALAVNAPEVFDGKVSTKSDLWSLGVTLLYATLGQWPYSARNRTEWVSLIRAMDPVIPGGIPEPLNAMIKGLLVRDRNARWSPDQVIRASGVAPATLGPTPTTVFGPGQDEELAAAVTSAVSGTRIGLLPGTYCPGRLAVDRPIELIGLGAPADVLLVATSLPLMVVRSAGARIHNITLSGGGEQDGPNAAVLEIRSGPLEMETCEVIGGGIGIHVVGKAANLVMRHCRIIANKHVGIQFDTDASGLIDQCEIEGSQTAGLAVGDRANPMVYRSTIRNSGLRAVRLAEHALGYFDDCDLIAEKALAVEAFRDGASVFARCRARSGGAKTIRASSLARAVFFKCDVTSDSDDPWHLTNGHQVQRI